MCSSDLEFFNIVKEKALSYYEKETQFALEESDSRDSEEKVSKSKTQKEARISEKANTSSKEQRFTAFTKQIEYLYETINSALGAETSGSSSAFKADFDTLIYDGMQEHKNAAEILTVFASVSSAGSENCLKWGYARKLTEFAQKAGLDTSEMSNTLKKLFICMKIRDLNFGASGKSKSTYEVANLLVTGEYANLLSGAHEYGGVQWFNKEIIESTLWFGFAGVVMYSPRILREHIYRLYRTLNAAKESSEYQCEKFTDTVKPAKPSKLAASSGKKSAEKKTVAKKTSPKDETKKAAKSSTKTTKKVAKDSKSSKQK